MEEYILNEINFVIETLINDNYMEQDYKKELDYIENLTEDDIKEIHKKIVNNDWFIQNLNELVNKTIEDEIFHYIHKKESEE